jgi:hypothetical protein
MLGLFALKHDRSALPETIEGNEPIAQKNGGPKERTGRRNQRHDTFPHFADRTMAMACSLPPGMRQFAFLIRTNKVDGRLQRPIAFALAVVSTTTFAGAQTAKTHMRNRNSGVNVVVRDSTLACISALAGFSAVVLTGWFIGMWSGSEGSQCVVCTKTVPFNGGKIRDSVRDEECPGKPADGLCETLPCSRRDDD